MKLLQVARTLLSVFLFLPALAFAAGGDLYVVAGFRTTGDIEQVMKFGPAAPQGGTFVTSARPYGVTFDSAGNLVMSDVVQHSIIKVAPNGTKTTFTTSVS